jgi:hypothetical protein
VNSICVCVCVCVCVRVYFLCSFLSFATYMTITCPRVVLPLLLPLLLLVVVVVDIFIPQSLAYDTVPFDPALACDSSYLFPRCTSAVHLQWLLHVYDCKIFRRTCHPPTASSGSPSAPVVPPHRTLLPPVNLWDSVRPFPKVSVYFHVGLYPRTGMVVKEIMTALSHSGLLREAVGVYVGISGIEVGTPRNVK